MKLVTFGPDFAPGLLKGDMVVDISSVVQGLPRHTPQALVEAIITNFEALRPQLQRILDSQTGVPLSQVRLRSPLPRPSKILCCIGNYREGSDREAQPIDLFLKSPDSVCGDGDTVVLPPIPATIFHHEAELAVVIGTIAKDVPQARAYDYIFGYTAFMDVSARGIGRPTYASFIGKSPDTFAPTGPCITTKDEIPDPHRLDVKYWVDGQIRHDYNTGDMEHPIPEVIEWVTQFITLNPGDIIAMGTNHQGIGPLQDGETGVIEVTGIGRMSIKVSDPSRRSWPKGVDEDMAARIRTAGR